MASPSSTSTEANSIDAEPVIENEIPTYRALSPLAITSTVLGVISALSFTDPIWLGASVLALITGFWAERKIRSMSDVLTGRSFAQAGIALGFMFGVSSLAYTYWSSHVAYSEARRLGIVLEKTLNNCKETNPVDTADMIWYMIPPMARKGLTPEDARIQIQKMTKQSEKMMDVDTRVREILKYAGSKKIEFIGVENAFYEDLDTIATLLFKVGDPVDGHDEKPGEAHDHEQEAGKTAKKQTGIAMIKAKGSLDGRKYKWWVDYVYFPYTPQSYKHVAEKKDDGHGHAH